MAPVFLAIAATSIIAWGWMVWPDPVALPKPNQPLGTPLTTTSEQSSLVVAMEHPALRRLTYLGRALHNSNRQVALNQLDLDSWLPIVMPNESRKFALLSGTQRNQFQDSLFVWLGQKAGFDRFSVDSLAHASYREQTGHDLAFELHTKGELDTRWLVSFNRTNDDWKLSSFTFEFPAETDPDSSSDEVPGKPKGPYIETELGGRILAGTIAKVPAWPGLSSTEATSIEATIDLAVAETGLESKLAREELKKLGPKPIPQVLNRIVLLPLDGSDDRLGEVAALDRILQTISGRVSTIPMRTFGGSEGQNLLAKQTNAIAAWFAWWKLWGKNWKGWREKTGLPDPNERPPGRTRG